jgi:hypothetical protein
MDKIRLVVVIVLLTISMACSVSGAFLGSQEDQVKEVSPTIQAEIQVPICPTSQCPAPVLPTPQAFEFFEDGDFDYVLDYDTKAWQFVETNRYPAWPRIVHRDIRECELFEFGATEPPPISPHEEEIGEYSWIVYGADDYSVREIWYSTLDSRVKITLMLPTWREDVHEQCRLAGISVLETLHLDE